MVVLIGAEEAGLLASGGSLFDPARYPFECFAAAAFKRQGRQLGDILVPDGTSLDRLVAIGVGKARRRSTSMPG